MTSFAAAVATSSSAAAREATSCLHFTRSHRLGRECVDQQRVERWIAAAAPRVARRRQRLSGAV
jgi:hypothetical protein